MTPAELLPLQIPLMQGPICDERVDLDGCYHDSCANIRYSSRLVFAEGPMCGELYHMGDCGHGSCQLISPEQFECEKHGWVLILNQGSGQGFAGGRIYWANLVCGCFAMDESDDIRAAE